MNPIHEAGFAATTLLLLASALPGLLAIACAALSLLRRATAARVLFALTCLLTTALMSLGSFTTSALHRRVEEAILGGGYGPPEFVRRQFAKEINDWHGSACTPAGLALTAGVLCLIVSGLPFGLKILRGGNLKRLGDLEYLAMGTAAAAAIVAAFEAFL